MSFKMVTRVQKKKLILFNAHIIAQNIDRIMTIPPANLTEYTHLFTFHLSLEYIQFLQLHVLLHYDKHGSMVTF